MQHEKVVDLDDAAYALERGTHCWHLKAAQPFFRAVGPDFDRASLTAELDLSRLDFVLLVAEFLGVKADLLLQLHVDICEFLFSSVVDFHAEFYKFAAHKTRFLKSLKVKFKK